MPIEKHLSVFVKSRVGSLNELCTALSEAHINIRAMNTVDDVDWAIVGLIVDDIDKARSVLEDLDLRVGESTILTVELENQPGSIADVTRKLTDSNINIVHTFVSAAGQRSLLVLMTTDNKRAAEILAA